MTATKSKSRGRPAHGPADIQAARMSILQAAARVFQRRGKDAPVGDILNEAEISRGTFYKYFPSKKALREALLEFGTTQLLVRIRDAVSRGEGPRAKLEAGIDAFLHVHTESPFVYRVLLGWALTPGTPLYGIRARTLDLAAAFIAEEFEGLGFPRLDPIVFQVLVGAIESASIRLLDGDGDIDPSVVARTREVLIRVVSATLQAEGDGLPPLPADPD